MTGIRKLAMSSLGMRSLPFGRGSLPTTHLAVGFLGHRLIATIIITIKRILIIIIIIIFSNIFIQFNFFQFKISFISRVLFLMDRAVRHAKRLFTTSLFAIAMGSYVH